MPAGAEWEWMEAYGLMEADPGKVHGSNWNEAISEVAGRLECRLPRESLEAKLRETAALADCPPKLILHRGSGWGALERKRRERFGERPFCSAGLVFDDESLGHDQTPWLALLQDGVLPENKPDDVPGSWMIQREWFSLLEASVQQPGGDHWLAHLHLGMMYYAEGNTEAAESSWQQSLRRRRSGWAYRNLAVLRRLSGRIGEALSFYNQAYQHLPKLRPLLVEYCECLLNADRSAEVVALVENAPKEIRCHSRVGLLKARAGLVLGLPDYCRPILSDGYELVDIREGESSLSDLWFEFQSQTSDKQNGRFPMNGSKIDLDGFAPLPRSLDFQVVPRPHSPTLADRHIATPKHQATSTGRRSD